MATISIPDLADGPKAQLTDPYTGKKRWMHPSEHQLLMDRWNAEQADLSDKSWEDAVPSHTSGVSIFGVPTARPEDDEVADLPDDPEAALAELKQSLIGIRQEMSGEARRSSFVNERKLLYTEFTTYQANHAATTDPRQKTQFWGRMKLIERRLQLLIDAEQAEKDHPGEIAFGSHRSSDLRFPVPLGEPVQFKGGVFVTSDPLMKAKVFQAIKTGRHHGLKVIRTQKVGSRTEPQRPYFHIESGEFQGWWFEDDLKSSGLPFKRYRRW